jgi:hypothetical protein
VVRVRLERITNSERRIERGPLRTGERVHPSGNRPQQLMQTRERKLGLGLDAHSAQHLPSKRIGPFAGVSQQGGLPDAGLPENNKRSASLVNSIEQLVETFDLSDAPDQPWNDRASRRGHGAEDSPAANLSPLSPGDHPGPKTYDHPVVGEITLDRDALTSDAEPDQQLRDACQTRAWGTSETGAANIRVTRLRSDPVIHGHL